MRRLLTGLALMGICLGTLVGCNTKNETNKNEVILTETSETIEETKKLSIVTTIFPQYDIVRQIGGDNVEVKMLLSPGAESHSYDPTPQDIITIQNSDVFIYVGGDSDEWVDRILGSMDTEGKEIIALMDLVDVVEEEFVEGMEHGHSHSHSHNNQFEDDEVKDRQLSDWYGKWQSVYPYLLDGTLDPVMEQKAEESDEKTTADYFEYYSVGYETDVTAIIIEGNSIEFHSNGEVMKSDYEYQGFEILTYESGNKGVRYLFEAVDKDSDAPSYVQFSDHIIAPEESEHFHIYFGNDSFDALLAEMDNWPTYYPADMNGTEIAEEMLEHDHNHDDDEQDEVEYDEHVWTSPKNAIRIVKAITAVLSARDESNAEIYAEAANQYIGELEKVDLAFREVVEGAARTTLIVGDRFPFRYFVDEYGLTYYAAFSGCATETDASAATIAFLIDKAKEEAVPAIFHIELSAARIADTICEETGAQKVVLHSGHNITKNEFEAGVGYLDILWQNVENLKIGLQ